MSMAKELESGEARGAGGLATEAPQHPCRRVERIAGASALAGVEGETLTAYTQGRDGFPDSSRKGKLTESHGACNLLVSRWTNSEGAPIRIDAVSAMYRFSAYAIMSRAYSRTRASKMGESSLIRQFLFSTLFSSLG